MTSHRAETVLAGLKDFQRKTVDYVFQRLYLDVPGTRRFLVADEVGLGKTMVAKGVIAKTLDHLAGRVERIDILYVCSNAAIAKQNVARLNVFGDKEIVSASRLTLLPTEVHGLRKNPVNFISFTPGTTFDLKSRCGIMKERAVLYRMLKDESWLDRRGLLNVLRRDVRRERWERYALDDASFKVDSVLSGDFCETIQQDTAFRARVIDLCDRFHRFNIKPVADRADQRVLIGELRKRLSEVCLEALEPDLIILDEFQRFRSLLRDDDPTAELAQALFNYKDARVLLLSATPYKMLSLDHEQEDDHYPDFLQTLRFLNGTAQPVDQVQDQIREFRRALLEISLDNTSAIQATREALQKTLGSVMCRTERVALTARHDAMLEEPPRPATLHPGDLHHASLIEGISRATGARDAVEYWKSAPYALNFMKGYQLKKNLGHLDADQQRAVTTILDRHSGQLLNRTTFSQYDAVEPANARLRSLFADTLDQGLWRVLWLPPSLPAWQLSGPFVGLSKVTKALVFSAWNVAPDAIAALCSYEAERRMLQDYERSGMTHETLYDRIKPLLRFATDPDGHRTGMPAVLLMYPSPTLASLVDPVGLSLELDENVLPSLLDVRVHVEGRVAELLRPLVDAAPTEGRDDERWYWAAPALLDQVFFPNVRAWCQDHWRYSAEVTDQETIESHFHDHVDHLIAVGDGTLPSALGRPPVDLAAVLTDVVLAGPGVCALRSLRRVASDLPWDDFSLLSAAATVAGGFRSLFNVPESIALLRSGTTDTAYWRLALQHGLDGDLSSLLDEQVHVLRESLGVGDKASGERVTGIAAELANALGIRTSQLTVDDFSTSAPGAGPKVDSFKLRCRFALRFGELRDEKTEARIETVRSAFNSPFRPFVLASTSVGQEGLDFHTWCHAVVHWNLPANPVDLEQREGRVHRYKGHAVRKNVAMELGRGALRGHWKDGADPWTLLFEQARAQRGGDLLTFWLYETEGGARIERRVPLLPFSRDVAQLARLKQGLALYRLVFGQPRQEDLLTHLTNRLSPEDIQRVVNEWRIDLTPPSVTS